MPAMLMRIQDALKLDDFYGAQHTSSIDKNCFEHFGTAGSSLGCEITKSFKKDLQLKREAIPVRA
ncbi:hypothetical protein E8E12_006392 [Didymella heteroderae]|uniref:Uncharacterized protein n=1 Tax=Didymella heteroderae TaxID=1769908 RepID=A0A9P4WLS2_9PLEO|nr:hypothetical protein E8E12_006392 [Didymella heteroderae]